MDSFSQLRSPLCHHHSRLVLRGRGNRIQDTIVFPCINDWQKDKPDPSTKAHLIKTLLIFLSLDKGHVPLGQRSA